MSTLLYDLRQRKNLSLQQLERLAEVSAPSIHRWERGSGSPKPEALDRVLRVLEATLEERRQVRDFFRELRTRASEALSSRSEEHVNRITALGSASPRRPDPTPITTPVELAEALNAVHIWAGMPSLRTLQEASNGDLRRATISDMLNTKKVEETQRVPDFDRYIAFLRLCGIRDTEDWVSAWRRLKARQRPQAGGWFQA
ncbi:helix-turn-helix domain-containing protein [Streptomyces sp. NPDC001581]|uniref:helix-turn-helix domain-containing protein n=1 Tax=Streptomyces sp. NPDC001581 TaxID=3154386 RepID=UPI0033189B89